MRLERIETIMNDNSCVLCVYVCVYVCVYMYVCVYVRLLASFLVFVCGMCDVWCTCTQLVSVSVLVLLLLLFVC